MSMKIAPYSHLSPRDQLAMLRLLCHIDGLNVLRSFSRAAAECIETLAVTRHGRDTATDDGAK